jgi:16S rRNA (guanine966-N2)-methyltransferase
LFNWLGQDLTGLSCLDLFAGSGALGFEAASRGAARVVMVDDSPTALAAIEANAKILGADERLEIVRSDAVRFVKLPRVRTSTYCFLIHRFTAAGSTGWHR